MSVHPPCAVLPETAKRLSGSQKAKQNKEVWVCGLRFQRNRDDDKLFLRAGRATQIYAAQV